MKKLNSTNTLTQETVKTLIEDTNKSKSKKIIELFENSYEINEIAKLLDIRYNFAYNVINNYINVNDIEIEENSRNSKKVEIFELFEKDATVKEIAKLTKSNMNYIYKLRKEFESIKEANKANNSKKEKKAN